MPIYSTRKIYHGLQNAINVASNTAQTAGITRAIAVQSTEATGHRANTRSIGKTIDIQTGNVHMNAAIFSPGDVFFVYNNSSANITITQNTGVTIYSPNPSAPLTPLTGSLNVHPRAYVTVTCVASNTFIVTGMGIGPR